MSRPRKELDVDTLAAQYNAGDTLIILARRTGVSTRTIRTRLQEAGVEIRPRTGGQPKDLPDPEMIRRYVDGESQAALADRYGVDPSLIRRRLRAAGVERRSREEANALSRKNGVWMGSVSK